MPSKSQHPPTTQPGAAALHPDLAHDMAELLAAALAGSAARELRRAGQHALVRQACTASAANSVAMLVAGRFEGLVRGGQSVAQALSHMLEERWVHALREAHAASANAGQASAHASSGVLQ